MKQEKNVNPSPIVPMMIIMVIGLTVLPLTVLAQSNSDYLILQNIGSYKLEERQKVVGGYVGGPRTFDGAGVIAPTGHFNIDHADKTYEVYYEGGDSLNSPTVQVTQHTGGDSDRWLLHEVEDSYRDGETETLGLLTQGARMREINGNKIISLRGNGYSWVSNNIVVDVSYKDLDGTKPEPIEVIQAYLAKFPSTITLTDADLKSDAYSVQWIKDEMERRLWLCDKWSLQFQAGKASQKDLLENLVNCMKVFLNYRQKYFGVSAEADIAELDSYWESNDTAAMQSKLSSYKAWWQANKKKSIRLKGSLLRKLLKRIS